MGKYLALYNIKIQPFEEAPEWEKRHYPFNAEDNVEARKMAEEHKTDLLRNELLHGSTVALERLMKVEDILE